MVCIWCFELRSKAVSKAQVHQMTMTRFELLGLEQGSAMVSSGRLMVYLLSFDCLVFCRKLCRLCKHPRRFDTVQSVRHPRRLGINFVNLFLIY